MKISRTYLYLAVLVAGCATLGVEISAAHLLRVVYGTADLVWAGVIGMMLLYLTAGYRLGGRWADRHPDPAVFVRLLLWAAFSAGLAAVATRLLLRPAAAAMASVNIGPAIGSFVAAMAILAVPVVLLGCVSPFALRLALGPAEGSGSAGEAAGRIYAASTLGSFVGTFLPPLLLVPLLGARLSYWVLAGTLLLVAQIGLAGRVSLSWAVLIAGLVSLGAEVAANRLLGPVFGTSNLVWAAVIGVNMAALAAGYFAGGQLADRFPDRKTFFILLLVAAATAALAPLSAGPALELARHLAPASTVGFFLAVILATAFLFALPVALMGCATPFALRLLLPESSRAGGTAGNLYAISTAGSLLGAFLPVLWLHPGRGRGRRCCCYWRSRSPWWRCSG